MKALYFPSGSLASELLGDIPDSLRSELLSTYEQIISSYLQGNWEPAELNGGKFCEVVYSPLKGHVDSKFPSSAYKPPRFDQACRDLESASGFPRSVRIGIPRVLVALYEIRNNRSVGHVGGEVNPNAMDAAVVVALTKWVMAELVRIFHKTTPEAASEAVEALTERTLPYVWEVNGMKRVLDSNDSQGDKVLQLLYATTHPVHERTLMEWVEVTHTGNFRRTLKALHASKYIEYSQKDGQVTISPRGAEKVKGVIDAKHSDRT